jgi:hypothetical protein
MCIIQASSAHQLCAHQVVVCVPICLLPRPLTPVFRHHIKEESSTLGVSSNNPTSRHVTSLVARDNPRGKSPSPHRRLSFFVRTAQVLPTPPQNPQFQPASQPASQPAGLARQTGNLRQLQHNTHRRFHTPGLVYMYRFKGGVGKRKEKVDGEGQKEEKWRKRGG